MKFFRRSNTKGLIQKNCNTLSKAQLISIHTRTCYITIVHVILKTLPFYGVLCNNLHVIENIGGVCHLRIHHNHDHFQLKTQKIDLLQNCLKDPKSQKRIQNLKRIKRLKEKGLLCLEEIVHWDLKILLSHDHHTTSVLYHIENCPLWKKIDLMIQYCPWRPVKYNRT